MECFLLLGFALEPFGLTLWRVTGGLSVTLIGLPVAALTFYQRFRQLRLVLRRHVLSERRRYRGNGFDSDVTFVHSTVLAMSWPAENVVRCFRNPAQEVEFLLDTLYGRYSYLVVNLCSERGYNKLRLFHGEFVRYQMDDHNPAELNEMLSFVREAGGFARKDPERRAVVVHCKGGKGRTGTMICAYLLYSGLQPTADGAFEHFGTMRATLGAQFQGVQTPSRERYVHYFEKLLTSLRPPFAVEPKMQPKQITRMELRNIPPFCRKGSIGKLWFVVILKPSTARRVIYISNPTFFFDAYPPGNSATHVWSKLRDSCVTAGTSLYGDSQEVNVSFPLCPCHDVFEVDVCGKQIDCAVIYSQYGATASKERERKKKVTLKALQLQQPAACRG
ncbi:tyrosine phosphatase isoform [Trypanosoma conorhini]|uniref:Tyrosine phosphatase isoform n=1 Tax=Trypanosoma conorhini TaxID=83891 RepID=A0A3R7P5U1_9TRYP|nr:tyrosine phosphatase isoform [Trypanosoma conorhini]RNF13221.1 tyrosine phosphatase isoform [Trypanosoma conorhini]